jgi:BRCT domain type II-containing protein
MRFFHMSHEEFENSMNLKNGQVIILKKNDKGYYELLTPLESKTKSSSYSSSSLSSTTSISRSSESKSDMTVLRVSDGV